MNHFNRSILITLLSLLFFSNYTIGQATENNLGSPIFVMSSVGGFSNISSQSPSVQFKSTSNCLDIENGLAIFNGERANGQFTLNCEVNYKFNSLGIKLYPNPTINNSKLEVGNTPPISESFTVCIWTPEGQLISSKKETGYSLMQGLNIDASVLSYGTYILRIESSMSVDAIKFIKAR